MSPSFISLSYIMMGIAGGRGLRYLTRLAYYFPQECDKVTANVQQNIYSDDAWGIAAKHMTKVFRYVRLYIFTQ